MNILINILILLALGTVLVHTICKAAQMGRDKWRGHSLQFIGICTSYGFVCGGAVGVAANLPFAPSLLLLGVAGCILFDRRNHFR